MPIRGATMQGGCCTLCTARIVLTPRTLAAPVGTACSAPISKPRRLLTKLTLGCQSCTKRVTSTHGLQTAAGRPSEAFRQLRRTRGATSSERSSHSERTERQRRPLRSPLGVGLPPRGPSASEGKHLIVARQQAELGPGPRVHIRRRLRPWQLVRSIKDLCLSVPCTTN